MVTLHYQLSTYCACICNIFCYLLAHIFGRSICPNFVIFDNDKITNVSIYEASLAVMPERSKFIFKVPNGGRLLPRCDSSILAFTSVKLFWQKTSNGVSTDQRLFHMTLLTLDSCLAKLGA